MEEWTIRATQLNRFGFARVVLAKRAEDYVHCSSGERGHSNDNATVIRKLVQECGLVLIKWQNLDSVGNAPTAGPEGLQAFLSELHGINQRECSGARVGSRGEGRVEGFKRIRRLGNTPGALFCKTGLEVSCSV